MEQSLAVTCGQQNWIEGGGDYDTGVCVSGRGGPGTGMALRQGGWVFVSISQSLDVGCPNCSR